MNRNVAIRRLWWKELRQLIPLVGLLLIVGLLLVLITLLDESSYYGNWRTLVVIFGLPGLFAAGAGALLVGQEKEARTLDWLRSLPIIPADILRTKLLVGLSGLLVVWLASFGFAAANGYLEVLGDGNGSEWLWIWPLHSIFLFLLGFAVSWQLRSSLIGLLCVVPLACVPSLFAQVHAFLLNVYQSPRLGEPRQWVMVMYLILFSVAALLWGWRAAVVYLSAERPSIPSRSRWSSPSRASFVAYAPSSPGPALLWQFLAQNRAVIVGISILLLGSPLASMLWTNGFSNRPRTSIFEFVIPPLLFADLLAVSWLGLLVFQGDALHRRKMFLADRGISPALTWLTRQAVPLLLLALFGILLIAIVQLDSAGTWNFNLFFFGAMVICGLFSISQWLGQVVSSPIVGALVGPMVGALSVGFFSFATNDLEASRWSVVVAIFVPLIATFAATSAWMDGRTGWRFWLWHAGLIVLVVLLPTASFLSDVVMYPRMSTASRLALKEIADKVVPYAFPYIPSIDPSLLSGDGLQGATEPDEPAASFAEERRRALENLRRLLQLPGIYWDSSVYATWLSDAIVNRLADPQASELVHTTSYRESIKLLGDLARRLRGSLLLVNQDFADQIELALLEEVSQPLASQRMGEELYESIAATLADQAARDQWRRHALAASWRESQNIRRPRANQNVNYDIFGGYSLQEQKGGIASARDVWNATREAGMLSEKLLQLIDANSDQERMDLRSQINAIFGYPPSFADANTMFQTTDHGRQLLYGELFSPRIPGQLWHREWEQRAKNVPRLVAPLER